MKKPLAPLELRSTMKEIRDEIIDEYGFKSEREINQGQCVEFAKRVKESFPQAEIYDARDSPPSFGDIFKTGSHVHRFVKLGRFFFDAEEVGGVTDWRELSQFQPHDDWGNPMKLPRVWIVRVK